MGMEKRIFRECDTHYILHIGNLSADRGGKRHRKFYAKELCASRYGVCAAGCDPLDSQNHAVFDPIGKLADKFAGAALGLAESVLIVWLGFLLLGVFDTLGLNAWVLEQVEQSRFLTIMYHSNYLIALLQKVLL